ncbi:cell surface protein [Candidatus Pacearchaeota archaeon]|nr:cell surface protein [Candidatus Pacearchaeota archaeon]
METSLQQYLDKALTVLQKYGIMPKQEDSELAKLLEDLTVVDEPRVLAIAKTTKNISAFNELVRDNVQDMHIGTRYEGITGLFDSIVTDAKDLVHQLDDGKIDRKEKWHNFWMRLARGTTHKRFDKITDLYKAVSEDTAEQLEKEQAIMDAYIDFRFALKNAEILSGEVLQTAEERLRNAETGFKEAAAKVEGYTGTDTSEKSRLELARDEAKRVFNDEDRRYQLIKDVNENLSTGYNVGEALVTKLKQTHDLKDRVYQRAVTFFTTNEHVFTTLDAVFTSQLGLHETTQTIEAMEKGVNKGLEAVAELGHTLEKAALKAGYGSTYNKDAVQKLVDAIVSYQVESIKAIAEYRQEATKNAEDISQIVEQGKKKSLEAITTYTNYVPAERFQKLEIRRD